MVGFARCSLLCFLPVGVNENRAHNVFVKTEVETLDLCVLAAERLPRHRATVCECVCVCVCVYLQDIAHLQPCGGTWLAGFSFQLLAVL